MGFLALIGLIVLYISWATWAEQRYQRQQKLKGKLPIVTADFTRRPTDLF